MIFMWQDYADKLQSIHLNVGPRRPSLDSISAKRCSTWELDTVGSVAIAVYYTCLFKVTLFLSARKHRLNHPPSWMEIRAMFEHAWQLFSCSRLVFAIKYPRALGTDLTKSYIIFPVGDQNFLVPSSRLEGIQVRAQCQGRLLVLQLLHR